MEFPRKRKFQKKWLIVGTAALAIVLLAITGYLFYRYDQASQPEVAVGSSEGQNNGQGISLPGASDSSGQVLGGPSGDSNSLGGGSAQQGSSTQQSGGGQSGSSQQPQPVRSQTLPNGLKIDEYNAGQGKTTKVGDTIAVHYIGYLPDGSVFDTSLKGEKKPFTFKLGAGQVIKGWDIGLQDMKVGGVRRLTIPADLAYGANGYPPTIPPNTQLVFDVQLMGIQ